MNVPVQAARLDPNDDNRRRGAQHAADDSLRNAFDRPARLACRLLGAQAAYVMLPHRGPDAITHVATYSRLSEMALTTIDDGFVLATLDSKGPLLIRDARSHPRFSS